MGNVKAKFRGQSKRLDLLEGIKVMTVEQMDEAL